MEHIQKKTQKTAEGLLRNRRGVGTCVRAYVLDTRAPVYGCVHTPKNVRDRIKRWVHICMLKRLLLCKGKTTLSTKSRWRFHTKRRSKESFDHPRLRTFRFHISRLVIVRQSKTRTNVEYHSRAAQLENDEMTKRVFLHPSESHIWCTLR